MKLQCKICGSNDLISKNEVIICEQCGCKYSIDEARTMISNEPDIPSTSLPENNLKTPEVPTKKKDYSFLILLIFACFCLVIILFVYTTISGASDPGTDKNLKQQLTEIIKQKPTVTCQETLTGFDFYINCNDNYSYVELEITFFDKNNNIVKTEILAGTNYKKGNTYVLSYTIKDLSSLVESLKANHISYKIIKYN